MKEKLHIGYFADGPWGHGTFRKIMEDDSLTMDFLCVRYEKKDEILMDLAVQNKIDVLYSPDINSEDFIKQLEAYSSDLYVSMSFNQIFHQKIRSIPRKKIINCHAGKLPFYRGRNILNWVLINDEKEFGITVHYVDSGIDTGDIILQKTYDITDSDDYRTLLEKAYEECPEILYQAIKSIQENKVDVVRQNDICSPGLYCGMRKEGDEILEWNQSSREIFNFIRALTLPGPCACSFIEGKRIKIISSKMIQNAPVYKGISGQVLVKEKNSLIVKTADSYIRVTEYEYDGKIRVGDRMGKDEKA